MAGLEQIVVQVNSISFSSSNSLTILPNAWIGLWTDLCQFLMGLIHVQRQVLPGQKIQYFCPSPPTSRQVAGSPEQQGGQGHHFLLPGPDTGLILDSYFSILRFTSEISETSPSPCFQLHVENPPRQEHSIVLVYPLVQLFYINLQHKNMTLFSFFIEQPLKMLIQKYVEIRAKTI